jgi:3-methyladenine DNA glycosylase AlkD
MATKSTPKKATKPNPAKAKAAPAQANGAATTLKDALRELESLGNASMRAQNAKGGAWGPGAGDNQFGVKHGDIRVLAKKIKPDHKLAMSLWDTGNIDAQYLAILLMKSKDLSAKDVDRLVRSVTFGWVADWLINYVVKQHADKETLRQQWMATDYPWAARAGWSLTAERVVKSPDGLDLPGLLDRLESEMGDADPVVQWTMNSALAEIGIRFPKLRKRAIAIGEKIGLYKDWPVSKGCIPPYVPVAVEAMVKRKG